MSLIPQSLRSILGINRRNLELVQAEKTRPQRALVDDKLATKQHLRTHAIPTPPDLYPVHGRADIRPAIAAIRRAPGAIIKPSSGLGGCGLMIVGRHTTNHDLCFHLAAICSGAFSKCEHDSAVVEPKLIDEASLRHIHGGSGLADLRVIVHRGQPLMAMLRLPCRRSHGAANLHAGGIGVGVDIETGLTTLGSQNNRLLLVHPDTRVKLGGYQYPDWSLVLDVSRQMNDIFSLDYVGVDIVCDQQLGIMVLEVNARPGLAVQVANQSGLRQCIEASQGGVAC